VVALVRMKDDLHLSFFSWLKKMVGSLGAGPYENATKCHPWRYGDGTSAANVGASVSAARSSAACR
jgi:hypothetical protein